MQLVREDLMVMGSVLTEEKLSVVRRAGDSAGVVGRTALSL